MKFYEMTMANIFIGCWPKRCLPSTNDGIADYASGLARVFGRVSPKTISDVCDFKTGIISWSKTLPTLNEMEEYCFRNETK